MGRFIVEPHRPSHNIAHGWRRKNRTTNSNTLCIVVLCECKDIFLIMHYSSSSLLSCGCRRQTLSSPSSMSVCKVLSVAITQLTYQHSTIIILTIRTQVHFFSMSSIMSAWLHSEHVSSTWQSPNTDNDPGQSGNAHNDNGRICDREFWTNTQHQRRSLPSHIIIHCYQVETER